MPDADRDHSGKAAAVNGQAAIAAVVAAASRLLEAAREGARRLVAADGPIAGQRAAHGLAWLACYVEGLRQLEAWGSRLDGSGRLGRIEQLILAAGAGEWGAQIAGGIAMSQGEIVRPADLGIAPEIAQRYEQSVAAALAHVPGGTVRAELADLIAQGAGASTIGDAALDETTTVIRDQMRRFAASAVAPHAHAWHRANAYVPLEVIAEMGRLGVFGVTVPETWGGMGLDKQAMCVVSEELSRAYIGVGSLPTRSEIAAELLIAHGTPEQQRELLPGIAAGDILPTAVFTEPEAGSDLASIATRAVRDGDVWRITGRKLWITHGARADLMTLLVRTEPDVAGYRGLSMLIASKARGSDEIPFPDHGISGSEIEVLGYRGMKEYEIAFDGFAVPHARLLGGMPGQGFKQLMSTFETARIQTAARAVGVAQAALDLALAYALERRQFGRAIYGFPRVADKISMMAVEIMIARQLTLYAAGEKAAGRRCDLEAGMAKLVAARVAWSAADNAVQIHGGMGFALESEVSRVLCDARILSIFEGAAEIQAEVIARRLIA